MPVDPFIEEVELADSEVRMIADWIDDSVDMHEYISLPTPNSEPKLHVFHRVGAHSKITLMHSASADLRYKRLWNVQPLSVFHLEELSENATQMDAFPDGDPTTFEILKFISDHAPDRTKLNVWQTEMSDIEGHVSLVNPAPLVPKTPLQQPKASILALVDALDAAKFIGVQKKVDHTRAAVFFDARHLPGRRTYLQAVLMSRTLFEKGQKAFPSNLSSAFYLAIMKKPGQIDPSMRSSEIKSILDSCKTDALIALPAPSAPRKRSLLLPVEDMEGDDGLPPPKKTNAVDDQFEGDVGVLKDKEASSSSSYYSSSTSSSSSSTSSKHSNNSMEGDGDGELEPYLPADIEGTPVRVEVHQGSGDRGLRLVCPVHGGACRKFRSLRKEMHLYGAKAAQYFLGAWIMKSHALPMGEHAKRHNDPTRTEVKAYIQRVERES